MRAPTGTDRPTATTARTGAAVDQPASTPLEVRTATLDRDGTILSCNAAWLDFGRPGGTGRDIGDNYLTFLIGRVSTDERSAFVGIEPFAPPQTNDHLRSILRSRPSVEAVAVGVDRHQVPCLLAMAVHPIIG
ncbi:MAG: hypothetical protein AAF547_06735, partial [Actinomycetota bacterium]